MKTIVEVYDADNRRPEVMERAGAILKKGGLVAFPTETVYGLGGDALNPEASARIYAAKGRPSDNPLIVHIAIWKRLKYWHRKFLRKPECWRIVFGRDH